MPSVSVNKLVKTVEEVDHQYSPEECLHQIHANIIFTMAEQPLDPVAFKQWHEKKWHTYSVLYQELP